MNDLAEAYGALFYGMFIIICISVPLGLWKLMDIIVWTFKNVSISIVG